LTSAESNFPENLYFLKMNEDQKCLNPLYFQQQALVKKSFRWQKLLNIFTKQNTGAR